VKLLSELPSVAAGPIGSELLATLRQQMAEGKFGDWSRTDNAAFRGVCFFGGANRVELESAAQASGVLTSCC